MSAWKPDPDDRVYIRQVLNMSLDTLNRDGVKDRPTYITVLKSVIKAMEAKERKLRRLVSRNQAAA